MNEHRPFDWKVYEGLFTYFEKHAISSLSEISKNFDVPLSAVYEPLKLIENLGIVEKIFPTPASEAYFRKCVKNS